MTAPGKVKRKSKFFSTAEREEGFLAAIKKYPGLQVISDNQYAGDTSDKAQTVAANMVDELRKANGIY